MTFLSSALPLSLIALFAFAATHAVRGYALRSLLDLPNARSSHQVPTPRGGGLGIVVAFSAAVAVLYWQGRVSLEFLMAMLAALPMAGIGFLDDHGHVPARWRFLVHVGCAIWALYWLDGLGSISVGASNYELGVIGPVLGAFVIVWLLNLFNFMDGIDGIAGTEAITACLSAAWLMPDGAASVPVLCTLAAATAGFLAWNWPPAKIFMGDVGSGFVGFLLGVLAVRSAIAGELSLAVWLILLGVFFVDATLTLLRRMAGGQRWYEAHRSHAYQHAAMHFGSHRPVTLAVLAINLFWLLPMAAAAVTWPQREAALLALAYAPLVLLALKLKAGKA